jgi:colanic acid/amylovoran biosynthesis glycosyltransferase
MRVAYLINEYPKVSHTFIRREILALEGQGLEVVRFALRGWDQQLADRNDVAEQEKTAYVLKSGLFGLLRAGLSMLLLGPGRFMRAMSDVHTLCWKGDRPVWVYPIYLLEAAWICGHITQLGKGQLPITHLHAHFGTNPAAVALLVQSLSGLSYSFTVHGPEEFDRPQALKLRFKASRAKYVVAISSFGRSQLYRWVNLEDWSKVKVVKCGLEQSYFESPLSVPYKTLPSDGFSTLLCIGRLSEQKGHSLLLDAVAQLHKRGLRFRLVLAGDGELRNVIESLIVFHGLSEEVRITGWISSEQVSTEIFKASVVVVPSFAEGLPVVIMEAMALGRPVISTYVAGIPELVVPGETGWLVPAGDVEALAEAMAQAIGSPSGVLNEMGRIGKIRVRNAHSIEQSASQLQRLFWG